MGKRRVLRKHEVVFLGTDGKWVLSTPTPSGFKHVTLGTSNSLPHKSDAEKRALQVLSS
jgi:hypothetical protein